MRFRREGSCFVLNIHKSYYETLYSRPVVALSGYCAKYDLPDSLYAYLAYGGPTGPPKAALVEGTPALATEKGALQAGPRGSGGSRGSCGGGPGRGAARAAGGRWGWGLA